MSLPATDSMRRRDAEVEPGSVERAQRRQGMGRAAEGLSRCSGQGHRRTGGTHLGERRQPECRTAPASLSGQVASLRLFAFCPLASLFVDRVLLSDAKIVALDEATANVDRGTDSLIQNSLHSLITNNDKTLLIIAHRIDTVMDCDLLLVLENGELVEFDAPSSLMTKEGGVFAGMVEAAKKATKVRSVESN